MLTIITDKINFASLKEVLKQFDQEAKVDIYSSEMSPIEQAIAIGHIEIKELIIQAKDNKLLFILNNGTVIERAINSLPNLANANETELNNYENLGNGILWEKILQADISLKRLLEEELWRKYNLKVV